MARAERLRRLSQTSQSKFLAFVDGCYKQLNQSVGQAARGAEEQSGCVACGGGSQGARAAASGGGGSVLETVARGRRATQLNPRPTGRMKECLASSERHSNIRHMVLRGLWAPVVVGGGGGRGGAIESTVMALQARNSKGLAERRAREAPESRALAERTACEAAVTANDSAKSTTAVHVASSLPTCVFPAPWSSKCSLRCWRGYRGKLQPSQTPPSLTQGSRCDKAMALQRTGMRAHRVLAACPSV